MRNVIIDTGPTGTSGAFRGLYNEIRAKNEAVDALFEILSPTEEDLAAAMQRTICAEIPLAIHRDWTMILKKLEEKKLPMPDASIANRASIVMKLTYRKIKMLFCGDAPAAAETFLKSCCK